MAREARYRRTIFDRWGPEAGLYLRAAGYGLMSIPLSYIVLGEAIRRLALKPPGSTLLMVVGIVVGYAVSVFAGIGIMNLGALPAGRIYMGGNSGTEEQYSQEQALVMQRRVDEALALYEHRILGEPGNVQARLRAADLYAGQGGNPKRAAELLREVQKIPGLAPGDGVYAGNRLADLYLGPLNEPGRAVVELRKLIDLYPGTPGAQQARSALAAIKARLHANEHD